MSSHEKEAARFAPCLVAARCAAVALARIVALGASLCILSHGRAVAQPHETAQISLAAGPLIRSGASGGSLLAGASVHVTARGRLEVDGRQIWTRASSAAGAQEGGRWSLLGGFRSRYVAVGASLASLSFIRERSLQAGVFAEFGLETGVRGRIEMGSSLWSSHPRFDGYLDNDAYFRVNLAVPIAIRDYTLVCRLRSQFLYFFGDFMTSLEGSMRLKLPDRERRVQVDPFVAYTRYFGFPFHPFNDRGNVLVLGVHLHLRTLRGS